MSTAKLRPTFTLTTLIPEQTFMARLKESATGEPGTLYGQFTTHHAMLALPEADRHFWSPWLHIEIRPPDKENQTSNTPHQPSSAHRYEVFGRFSPHPSVWTAFMFSYLSLSVLCFFAIIFGASQWVAGERPFGFYLVPVCLLVAILLWFAARFGQGLAVSQMSTLRKVVEECSESIEP